MSGSPESEAHSTSRWGRFRQHVKKSWGDTRTIELFVSVIFSVWTIVLTSLLLSSDHEKVEISKKQVSISTEQVEISRRQVEITNKQVEIFNKQVEILANQGNQIERTANEFAKSRISELQLMLRPGLTGPRGGEIRQYAIRAIMDLFPNQKLLDNNYKIDLRSAQLQELDLRGIDFSGALMQRADLTKAQLE